MPIEYRRRLGRKKLGVRHGFRIALDMIRLAYRYNPVVIVFIPSAILLLLGIGILSYVAYHYIVYGVKHYVKALIGLIVLTLGGVGVFVSLLSVYLKRMEIRMYRRIRSLEKRLESREQG